LLKIIVTFAVGAEFATWRRISHFEPSPGAGIPTYVMRTPGAEVHAVITSIGVRSARQELQDMFFASPRADLCIASGLAGGLRNNYGVGEILVAKAVKSNDAEGQVRSDASLVRKALACGADVVDCFFTSGAVVNSAAEKLRLGTIADAVEMESFYVLDLARRAGIPAVTVRAISDAAETDVPIDFNRVIDGRGQISRAAALYEIAKAPERMPQLIRFGLQSGRARRRLAEFLDRYVQALTQEGKQTLAQVEMK
jgi:nucleoside phosphorylase